MVGYWENLSGVVVSHSNAFLVRVKGYNEGIQGLTKDVQNTYKLVEAAQNVSLAGRQSMEKNMEPNEIIFVGVRVGPVNDVLRPEGGLLGHSR